MSDDESYAIYHFLCRVCAEYMESETGRMTCVVGQ